MRKPKRPCSSPACPNLADGRYCTDHAHIADQQRRSRYKQYDTHQRDQQAAQFYKSIEWQRVREQAIMRDHGLCVECLRDKRITTADVVDHIKPLRHFRHLGLMLSNLQPLCHMHHNRKTAEDKRKYGSG